VKAPIVIQPQPGPAPPPAAAAPAGPSRDVVVHLRKGDKDAKALKELTGTVAAEVLGEPTAVIMAPDILKAAGKEFKGGENGVLKVQDVTRADNGAVDVRLELSPPSDSQPMSGAVGPVGGYAPAGTRPIRRGAAVPPAPGGPAGGVAIGIVAPPPPGGSMPAAAGYGLSGLSLLDDKGEAFQPAGCRAEPGPDGGVRWVLTFTPQKGQGDAAKLVYRARKSVAVDVPFTLKDVPLP
jgi:hypothetical protein